MDMGDGEVSGLKRGQMESKQVRELLERSQLESGKVSFRSMAAKDLRKIKMCPYKRAV